MHLASRPTSALAERSIVIRRFAAHENGKNRVLRCGERRGTKRVGFFSKTGTPSGGSFTAFLEEERNGHEQPS